MSDHGSSREVSWLVWLVANVFIEHAEFDFRRWPDGSVIVHVSLGHLELSSIDAIQLFVA